MAYFVIGLICGLIVMAVICEKAHRQEVSELKAKINQDRQYHYDVVTNLENELKTQRNVSESLNASVNRLRRENERLKKR